MLPIVFFAAPGDGEIWQVKRAICGVQRALVFKGNVTIKQHVGYDYFRFRTDHDISERPVDFVLLEISLASQQFETIRSGCEVKQGAVDADEVRAFRSVNFKEGRDVLFYE